MKCPKITARSLTSEDHILYIRFLAHKQIIHLAVTKTQEVEKCILSY